MEQYAAMLATAHDAVKSGDIHKVWPAHVPWWRRCWRWLVRPPRRAIRTRDYLFGLITGLGLLVSTLGLHVLLPAINAAFIASIALAFTKTLHSDAR